MNPDKLRDVMHDAINRASHDFDVVFLGYDMCPMAVVGLTSHN